ncbi:hypothetical protein J6590_018195 [Homalodisca vitripennis]|nr:hypothetical protein J6590_018195 [Homalodisca vitripennis]
MVFSKTTARPLGLGVRGSAETFRGIAEDGAPELQKLYNTAEHSEHTPLSGGRRGWRAGSGRLALRQASSETRSPEKDTLLQQLADSILTIWFTRDR